LTDGRLTDGKFVGGRLTDGRGVGARLKFGCDKEPRLKFGCGTARLIDGLRLNDGIDGRAPPEKPPMLRPPPPPRKPRAKTDVPCTCHKTIAAATIANDFLIASTPY